MAAGGSLTRFGHDEYLYIAMSSGVAIMFWGYLKTIRPAALHKDNAAAVKQSPLPPLPGQPALTTISS
ncbi:MAG: hypothetical protein R2911_41325 [Caldilineaceae bacterium]